MGTHASLHTSAPCQAMGASDLVEASAQHEEGSGEDRNQSPDTSPDSSEGSGAHAAFVIIAVIININGTPHWLGPGKHPFHLGGNGSVIRKSGNGRYMCLQFQGSAEERSNAL